MFDGFSAFNQPVEVEFAGVTLRFTPDRAGRFRSDSAEFAVLNVSPFGVVCGGEMEFRLILRGTKWLQGLPASLGQRVGTPPAGVPLRMQVGRAIHRADVHWQPRAAE